jgi:hypothetical protein
MSLTEEIQYSLTINTEVSYNNLRKLETVLMRVFSYIEKLSGGDPNLSKLINTIQAAIVALRTLQLAMRAVQAASGPIGWAYAATSFAAVGFAGLSMLDASQM